MPSRQNKGKGSTSRSSWTQKRHLLDTGMDLEQMRTLRKKENRRQTRTCQQKILSAKDSPAAKENLVAEENPHPLSTLSQLHNVCEPPWILSSEELPEYSRKLGKQTWALSGTTFQ